MRLPTTAPSKRIDFSGFVCEPPDEAHSEYARLNGEAVALSGGDAAIGPRLPLMGAGLGPTPELSPAHSPATRSTTLLRGRIVGGPDEPWDLP
jgi:hypothetical protein